MWLSLGGLNRKTIFLAEGITHPHATATFTTAPASRKMAMRRRRRLTAER